MLLQVRYCKVWYFFLFHQLSPWLLECSVWQAVMTENCNAYTLHTYSTIHSLGGDEKGLYLINKEEFEIRCLCIGNVLLLIRVDSQLCSPVNNISWEKPV
jgi:hypothetical protein